MLRCAQQDRERSGSIGKEILRYAQQDSQALSRTGLDLALEQELSSSGAVTFPVREDDENELTPASLSQLYAHFRRTLNNGGSSLQ